LSRSDCISGLSGLIDGFAEAGQAFLVPNPEAEVEYTRLFLNPLGAPCPPWQSVFAPPVGEPPRLMGESHHGALAWYRELGFDTVAENEPADHIGLLLLFYAKLLSEDVAGEELARFRRDHFAWLPDFLAKMAAASRHPFYRQLALSTRQLVESEF
jgi:TorA maturation chaperone TorD